MIDLTVKQNYLWMPDCYLGHDVWLVVIPLSAPWLEAQLRQQVRPIFQRGYDAGWPVRLTRQAALRVGGLRSDFFFSPNA
jgi:hypothetical protein